MNTKFLTKFFGIIILVIISPVSQPVSIIWAVIPVFFSLFIIDQTWGVLPLYLGSKEPCILKDNIFG